jgi:hypothetical protein
LRLGSGEGGRAVVFRIEAGERVTLAPVATAALVAAAVLCATDTPPTLAGLSVVGCATLVAALALVVRILRA